MARAAESDDGTGVAANRNDEPVPEPIDGLAVVALNDQSALNEHSLGEALVQQDLFHAVARGRGKPEAELLDGLGADATVVQLPARPGPGCTGQLLAIVRGGHLVHLQESFAEFGILPRVVGRPLGLFGHRHAQLLRDHPHRVREPYLLVQFEEFEDVTPDAAAETVKEPLFRVDVERGRLLGVKRAKALVGCSGAPQRHVILHDLHDIGLQAKVVDELLGEQRHIDLSFEALTFVVPSSRTEHGARNERYSFNSTTVTPPPPCSGGPPRIARPADVAAGTP